MNLWAVNIEAMLEIEAATVAEAIEAAEWAIDHTLQGHVDIRKRRIASAASGVLLYTPRLLDDLADEGSENGQLS